MTDYRSEYERYYRNINRTAINNEHKKHLFFKHKEKDSLIIPYRSRNQDDSYTIKERFIKIFIRQLEGSLILLIVFMGLKTAPSKSAQTICGQVKYAINQTFEYDTTIDTVSKMNVAGFELHNLHLENFKSTNIKERLSGFINYMKNINTTNIEAEY